MSTPRPGWTTTSLVALASASVPALFPPPAQAAQYMSVEQAQKAAFPEADRFETRNLRLTPEQIKALDGVASVRQRGEIRRIDAWAGNKQLGTIYVDDVIGKVEVKLGEEVVHSADLIALEPVEEGGFFRRLWDSIRLFFYGLFN